MLSFTLNGRWTPPVNKDRAQSDLFTVQYCHSYSKADGPLCAKHCQSTEWSLHCSMLSFRSKDRWTPLVNFVRAELSLHCSMLSFSLKGRWIPQSTLSEHRVISSLFNVVIQTQRQMDPLCAKHCQSTEWSLHCSMLSLSLKGRWTPLVYIVRAQSYLFTVQCCHSDSKADWHPPVNTVRTQSYFFTVQCCHSDSKADEPPAKHCQSTEWSLHCSMLSFRLKGRWKPLVNFVRAELSLHCSMLSFRLKGRWTPQSTLSEHRVISSLFNVVIQTQRQMDPLCAKHCQSTEWSLHCSILSLRLKGRWTPLVNIVRAQSDLFTVQCCHSDSKADGHPSEHCQSTELSLHCSMLSFRLKGRGTPPQSTLSEHRVISSLFNVVIETQRQMDLTSQHCQSTEWSLHCSMLLFRLKGRLTPPSQHCQNTELSLHCSMLSFRLKGRWTPCKTLSEHRVISSLFNVVIQTQGRWTPCKTQSEDRVISSLFNVVIQTQRQVDRPWSTLSEHRVISSLFNVVIPTQMQMDPPANTVRAQSDLFTVQCCHSDLKADGPHWSTLSEHRVISSLFNVVI